ncbi:hypothetical protein DPMN_021269 [Dreissena polymorpha]|uniref:Uncharacterized protein n=1 Tax=Dreissena polymorpha TaxID=45954 RepID=A0A9D4NMG7_DREPO|nr:hypothetical protein DPMN_021269 [Dreissena polymorpha]
MGEEEEGEKVRYGHEWGGGEGRVSQIWTWMERRRESKLDMDMNGGGGRVSQIWT